MKIWYIFLFLTYSITPMNSNSDLERDIEAQLTKISSYSESDLFKVKPDKDKNLGPSLSKSLSSAEISDLTRLKNMDIEPYLIAAVLKSSLAQRLVRKICDECKQKKKPSRAEKELLVRNNLSSATVFKGSGCKVCQNTGYHGRVGLFELFVADGKIEEMIVSGKRDAEIKSYLNSLGMEPLIIDGLKKVLQGVTTISEIERAVTG